MNKIAPENLLSRGFSKRDRNVNGFLGDSFYFEVFDVDMPDYEKMAIFIERGNGYDEECWNGTSKQEKQKQTPKTSICASKQLMRLTANNKKLH